MEYKCSWNKYFQKISVHCEINLYIGYRKQNDGRILAVSLKCISNYRKFSQQLRQQCKRKGPDTTSYQSGAFSTM